MLFFYDRVSDFNKSYSTLLGIQTEKEEVIESGNTEEVGRTTFADKWGWISNVKVVSDMVHSPWDEVFRMNIVEFLNILSFARDYNAEQERIMKEQMRKK